MFKPRTFVALGFVAVVGIGAAIVLTRPDRNVKLPEQRGLPSWPMAARSGVPAPEIDELEIAEAGKPRLVLKKQGDVWMIVEPIADRADQKAVAMATSALGGFRFKDVIAESPDSYAKVQVKDDEVTIVVARKGGQDVAAVLLGKTTNVRLPSDARVFSTMGLKRGALVREVTNWRDREIMRFEKEKLDRVELAYADGRKIAIKREAPPPTVPDEAREGADTRKKPPPAPDKYTLVEGQAAVGGPLDEQVASAVVSTLLRLDANEFADGVTPEASGLAPPRAVVTVLLTDGTRKQLLVGKNEGEDAYLKMPEGPKIWKVRKVHADNLSKSPLQWRDKMVVKIPAAELRKIDISKGTEKLVLEMGGAPASALESAWKITVPAGAELDPGRANMVAGSFGSLRASSIAENPAAFTKPTGTVTLTRADGATTTITVGVLQPDKSYPVKVTGRSEVFILGESAVNRFLKTAAEMKKTPPKPDAPPGM